MSTELPPTGDENTPHDVPTEKIEAAKKLSLKMKSAIAVGTLVVIGGVVFGINQATADSGSSSTHGDHGMRNGGNRQGGGTFGTVKSIDGSKIVLTSSMGGSSSTTTVKTDGSTKYTATDTGAFSDLKVGDNVNVRSAPGSTGITVTATSISDTGALADTGPGGPGGPGGRNGAGRNGGAPPGAPAGMAPPGDGNGPSDMGGAPPVGNDVNAQSAQGGQPGQGNGRRGGFGGIRGTIKSIDGASVVITLQSGTTVTVNTSASTTYRVTKTIGLSDIKTGDTLMVQGKKGSDGTVTATNIRKEDKTTAPQ